LAANFHKLVKGTWEFVHIVFSKNSRGKVLIIAKQNNPTPVIIKNEAFIDTVDRYIMKDFLTEN